MANSNSPTLVSASLSDEQLKKSIDSLVTHVDEAMKKMVQSTNNAVGEMEAKLKSLGNLKIDSGGSADGGASKRAKAQNEETEAVERTNAARDKQIRKNQEVKMSYDQMQSVTQSAANGGKMSIIETYDMQIKLLIGRLREVRQDIDIFNAAIGSGKKTQIEWGRQGLKEANAEAERLMKTITTLESQRGNLSNLLAPQGHTIQNYVNSLQKANPELALLNEQFRGGNSLLQQQSVSLQQQSTAVKNTVAAERDLIEEEKHRLTLIREIAAEARASMSKYGSSAYLTSYHSESGGAYIYAENDARAKGLTIEQQIANIIRENNALYYDGAKAASMIVEEEKKITQEQDKRKSYKAPVTTINESFKRLTANALGVDTFAIDSTSTKISKMTTYVRQLETAYSNLTIKEQQSPFGKQLREEIQTTSRVIQQFRSEMSRPINLQAALQGSEKTLDDIAYKMRRLQSYRSGLDVSTQKNEITQINSEYDRLKKKMDEVMGKNQQMIASNTALGRSWNYMKNRLAFYFTVGASTQFIKNLIEVRSQYEMNERALGILINSAERGTQIFNELSQMALVSPYTLIELSAAAKQLTAYDVAAKDVVDTTRRLADMAAAVGIPIERLTYALGQIKAYGYLNSRDNRMFANAGIPLVKQLSDYYTELEGRLVSTADVYDRIKNKQVGYEEVMNVISRMTDEGGKFYDFQAKMAETLKVQLANLTLAWNNMLNAMGEESQGVLVGSISALKQLFLHWKDIEHVLYELVAAFGAYKAYQIITTRLMGATAASLDAQILAMKRNKAAMLEKQALTRKLTEDELRQVAAQKQITATDYQNALSGKKLTKQKALLLAAIYKNNVQLKAALVNMGLLTTAEAASITRGKALAIVFKSIGISIRNAALAVKAFISSMLPLLVVGAIYELYHAWDSYGEHVKEVNKQAAEHAKEAFENIKTYLEGDVTNTLRETLRQGGKVSSDAEGQKTWDEMREKIELSSSASNVFIARLMQIDDINERLSAGFGYLEDIQRVAGVMQTLEEKAVDVSSTTWGGLLGEGLKDDLQDFLNSKDDIVSAYGDIGTAYKDMKRQLSTGLSVSRTLGDLKEFVDEVQTSTNSIYDIASREGFNTTQQREFFEREISEIAQAEQMGAKETRVFRMQAEKEYYAYARAQLVAQLEYQQGAQKAATEKRIKDLDNEFGTNKAMQESFFTWLTEKQDHAVKNMLRGKTQEEIKQGEWLKGANGKWVEEMARKFSQEYGVSFDDLHRLVMNANTWSINIPVFFQTIGQPLTDVQRDYEARTGKKFSSNPLIKDAKSQVEILDILKKKQKEVAQEMETAQKAGLQYWESHKQELKEENDALIADIHAYNAMTDAEEKANKKGNRGSKKDPLLDALKEEISLVDKLQGDYDKLTKSSSSQAEALETIRGAYGKTIRLLNAQLGKYGLPQLNISQLITGKDPHKALEHFKQTLDTLVSKGLLTLERSKEIEAVIDKFTLSAKTYDLDMITKGLNNELGKLKDEYELALELDANPELGDMFADVMNINVDSLPQTFGEALDRANEIARKKLRELNINADGFDLISSVISQDKSGRWMGLDFNSNAVQELLKAQKTWQDMFKKNLVDSEKMLDDYVKKYGDYSDKMAEIESDRLEKIKRLNDTYYNEDLRNTAAYRAKKNAIEQGAERERGRVRFDEFKNSRLYITLFENLDHASTATLTEIRKRLSELKDEMGSLSPEQLKQITTQFEKIDKELMSRNPFKGLLKSARDYAKAIGKDGKAAQKDFITAQDAYDEQLKVVTVLKEQLEQKKSQDPQDKNAIRHLEQMILLEDGILKKKKEQLEKAEELNEKYDMMRKIFKEQSAEASKTLQIIGANLSALGEFRDQLNELFGKDASVGESVLGHNLDGIIDGLSKAGDAIGKTISSLESGNFVGAASGAISLFTGVGDAIASAFGGGAARTRRLNREINNSKETVRRLNMAYEDLSRAVEKSLGTAETEARRAAIANKELELSELERQKRLEESKRSKDRDKEAIIQYEESIHTLKNEIEDLKEELVTNLFGDDVKSAAESFVDAWVEAWRAGETTLDAMQEKMDEMIYHLVKKAMTSKIVESLLSPLYKELDDMTKGASEGGVALTVNELRQLAKLAGVTAGQINTALGEFYGSLEGILPRGANDSQLSALAQGIQNITEPTAEALEAYANSMSQQAYLRNDLLVQIRDTIMSFDVDIQLGVFSQMLLQLQNNYIVMQSMQSMMESWTIPSGSGIRVELLS